ncbi:TfoX/Sxy family protein [Devosia sp.]|jgi:TfoX/Sxy family transcriptional regulator of competence genes|uniref:TfoX/Sxy family protein n=1 Tax=Devosia sp. TaxID=1871048 RepID=UPI0019FF2D0D|nr:TfoX/Sxy family protein [Devosia sp.]MBE0581353.1 TfoX/Sxy family protein [Devosia sp.]
MSLASDELSDRIRTHLGAHPAIAEQKMFGGRAFMLHGNMLVCPMKDGGLLVRVGKERYDEALALPGARPMTMGARTMSGFVEVTGDMLEDDEVLLDWIELARSFVDTLPAK